MKWIRNFLFLVLVVVLLAASVVEMMVLFPVDSVVFAPIRGFGDWAIRRTVPTPEMKFWFWFGIFWVTIGVACLSWGLRRTAAGVVVKMENGKVVILESAIRKYLRNSLANFSAVNLQKIDIYRQRNGLHVDLYAQVRAQANLPDLENRLIEEVKRALRENLGIEEIAAVRFFVRDFQVTVEPPLVAPRQTERAEVTPWASEATSEPTTGLRAEQEAPIDLAAAWSREEPDARSVEPILEENAVQTVDEIPRPEPAKEKSGFLGFWRRKKPVEESGITDESETETPTSQTTSDEEDTKQS